MGDKKTVTIPYSTLILVLVAVLCVVGYLYLYGSDRSDKALKMRLDTLRDSLELYQGKIDSVLVLNEDLEDRVDSLDQELEARQDKVTNEIKIIEYREKEFKTLDDHSRDTIIRAYIAANQVTDW